MNYIRAINSLRKGSSYTAMTEKYEDIIWQDENTTIPTQKECEDEIKRLENAESMRLLREERNRRIAETDWWVLPDRTASQEQKDYRQALRDLPSTFSPVLDILMENGDRILKEQTDWPTKPA